MADCDMQAAARGQSWFKQTNGLPRSIVLSLILITWTESFPLTAFTALLTDEIGMSLSTITTYYSVSFLPYMWKPVFGWISDSFPIFGFHRIPYITGSALGWAVAHLLFALSVRSAWEAFAASLCLTTCGAFLQLMVGGFVVDIARQDVSSSVAIQSVVNTAQWVGTLLAQVMAIAIYAHGGGASSGVPAVRARSAIAMTSAAPALVALLAPFLPEKRLAGSPWGGQGQRTLTREGLRFGATVALLQGNLVLIGCQSLMVFRVWCYSVAIAAATSACLLALVYLPSGCLAERRAGAAPVLQAPEGAGQSTWWWARVCIFCFAANVIPKSTVAVGQFQYVVFTADGYQALKIISALASISASLVFGRAFNKSGLRRVLALSASVAATAALSPMPFAVAALHGSETRQQLWSQAGALGIAATILGAFASLFSVLPVDTIVTCASGSVGVDRSCTAYAAFLSCYSFGATVGGLATAPILQAMGLTGHEWAALPAWIAAAAVGQLLVLPLLPLLPALRSGPASGSEDVTSNGQVECEVSLEAPLNDLRTREGAA